MLTDLIPSPQNATRQNATRGLSPNSKPRIKNAVTRVIADLQMGQNISRLDGPRITDRRQLNEMQKPICGCYK